LSNTDLPQPVVLVVGDDASEFSSEVWRGVVEAAAVEHQKSVEITAGRLEPLLEADYEEVHKLLDKLGMAWTKRPRTRRPIPLQLSHSHAPDPATLRENLGRLLDLFDVWAIVASASAGDVKPLRQAIEGIDIPLLVTTDSTTVSASDQRSNELRLMPSNKAQATAMLFTAVRVNEESGLASGESAPIRALPKIACHYETTPQAREYVNNLKEQLESEARRYNIKIGDYTRADNKGPVIVVGYSGHAESIINARVSERLTILSDGCATGSVRQAVKGQRGNEADYWYVARPEIELEKLGHTSFSAVREAGRRLLTWDENRASEQTLPRTSLRDVIKEILTESNKLFTFDGIENVAPAYRVEPVLEIVDPDKAVPPGRVPAKPKAERHLSAVR
jgi:hypothetical protein